MRGNGPVWRRWFRSAAARPGVEVVGLYPITRADPDDGWIHTPWNPNALFPSGEAALGIEALIDPVADRQARPGSWTRWRRTREGYDYWSCGAWRAVSSTIAPAPANLALDGHYVNESCTQPAARDGIAWMSW